MKSKKIFPIFLIIFLIFLTVSNSKTQDKIHILIGNWRYKNGLYDSAIIKFLKVKEGAVKKADRELLSAANYSLGLCYAKMEEKEAALAHFKAAAETDDKKIRFRSLFNAGILYYDALNYSKAAECFKQATISDNSKIESKVNFEISSVSKSMEKKSFQEKKQQMNENQDELKKEIFQKIANKESNIFKNAEKPTYSQGDKNDY